MPAVQTLAIKKLGIIAGCGILPLQLADMCKEQGIEPFLIGFEGQTDIAPHLHLKTSLGRAGLVVRTLKAQGIKDIVMIGAMRRPKAFQLWPDLFALKFFAKIGFRVLGDNGLLSAIRRELEHEGFCVHGVHRFMPQLLSPQGSVTKSVPDEGLRQSISLGIRESQNIGTKDIGQSVIVQGERILGTENDRGTNALIKRCARLIDGAVPAILVKTCKPQQDRDLDMPTIGPATVQACHEAGIAGIIVQAEASLLVEREKLVELADAYKIFVCGVRIEDYL